MGRLALAMIARAFGLHELHKLPNNIYHTAGIVLVTVMLFIYACNSVWKRKHGLKKASFLRIFFEYIAVIIAVAFIVPPYTFFGLFLPPGDDVPTPALFRIVVPLIGLSIFTIISCKEHVEQKGEGK